MLDLLGGLFSVFFSSTSPVEPLQATNWGPWRDSSWVRSLVAPSPDPIAQLAVQQHLGALAAAGLPSGGQAVWMQTGEQVLVEHQGTVPLSAASLTKVATTFAALTTWGPNHQFETIVSATAPVQAGVVQGDLIVQGQGDPFFVWEEAIALGNAINQAGIRQVTGNLIIAGNFAMNFDSDPLSSGNALKQALNANLWSGEIEMQYQTIAANLPRPQVEIQGNVVLGQAPENAKPIVRHQSMPMVDLLKAMNVYSNNFMSEMIADSVGGATVVMSKASELAKVSPAEIQLGNGSGLGTENRLSPRAVATLLIATQRYLQARNLTIADVYPVIGIDSGTLKWRNLPLGTVVKTGTLDQVSALAGVLPTRDRGLVWFSIINLGAGDIEKFHQQQDQLLNQVDQAWGKANSALVQPTQHNADGSNRLGTAARNQLEVQS